MYLAQIAESIHQVRVYLGDPPDRRLFLEDMLTQDAALRRMEIAAAGASHLSAELKARHPDGHWRQLGEFRNILAHDYLDLDLDHAWRAVMSDLAALQDVIRQERGDA